MLSERDQPSILIFFSIFDYHTKQASSSESRREPFGHGLVNMSADLFGLEEHLHDHCFLPYLDLEPHLFNGKHTITIGIVSGARSAICYNHPRGEPDSLNLEVRYSTPVIPSV
jgi:hypothetical protein